MITELGHKITLHAGPNFQPDLMMMNGNLMIIIDRTLFCAVSDLREAIAWALSTPCRSLWFNVS